MITDQAHVIDIMTDALLRKLGDEVDLIVQYGSQVKGNTHTYSDIDISYVPRYESTRGNITIMVEDLLVDLYPMRWSTLEQMATFDNISSSVLLTHRIVYQRNDEVLERFYGLKQRLETLLQPSAYPDMVRKAQGMFQQVAYQHYLLTEVAQEGRFLPCLYHAHALLKGLLHSLAVLNQHVIDTRKLDQIRALPKLPHDFDPTLDAIVQATDCQSLLESVSTLMRHTRQLLFAEQQSALRSDGGFPEILDSAYPELKGDIQHLMLLREQRTLFNFNLTSLYHELMVHTAQAIDGVQYSPFNSLLDYEQDFDALGFPNLVDNWLARDFEGLYEQSLVFDQKLRAYLTERGVSLNDFDNLDALKTYLDNL